MNFKIFNLRDGSEVLVRRDRNEDSETVVFSTFGIKEKEKPEDEDISDYCFEETIYFKESYHAIEFLRMVDDRFIEKFLDENGVKIK